MPTKCTGPGTTTTPRGIEHVANNGTPVVLLLTPQEAAKALALSPRKLWDLTASGAIPHVKIGRCTRYAIDDLRQFIEGKKKGGDAQ